MNGAKREPKRQVLCNLIEIFQWADVNPADHYGHFLDVVWLLR